ncbi:hypothetical protein COCNU_02G006150 [Cocos nucifera]|uniref:Uncharacterized protein n=1 Tax=Cocos nucifera TaxID=13894 RepID=A0A8K0HZ70_COCNU|nr:hypothetical protein COCNU_02G006150 [Cocos nucifera]
MIDCSIRGDRRREQANRVVGAVGSWRNRREGDRWWEQLARKAILAVVVNLKWEGRWLVRCRVLGKEGLVKPSRMMRSWVAASVGKGDTDASLHEDARRWLDTVWRSRGPG